MSALPWFRMYHEFANDPKVQMLSEADQRRFIMLLCIRCSNGDVTVNDDAVAFQLRINADEWAATKARLVERNLIDADNKPVNWGKRQQPSDSSKSRVSKHREAKKQERNGAVTDVKQSGNAPDLEADIDTDTEKAAPLPPQQAARSRQQVKNLVLKGAGVRVTAEVRDLTRKRAEGLGLPVEAILAETFESEPTNADAYFRAICRRRLKLQLPGISDDLLSAAFERDGKAFASVCGLLTMGSMQ